MKSQKGIWFRLENTAEHSHELVTFSTEDVRHAGLVRLDVSKVGIREHLVPIVNFDEVSGRIIVLARTFDGRSHVNYGFIVDMP